RCLSVPLLVRAGAARLLLSFPTRRSSDLRRQAGVELVAVPVAVRAAGMAGLGAAGDVDGAAARRLQRLDSLDRGEVDLLERRAGRVVAVAAVAARRPRDARRAQALCGVAVAELGGLLAGLLRGRGR